MLSLIQTKGIGKAMGIGEWVAEFALVLVCGIALVKIMEHWDRK
jgi:hypothetical protein